MTPKFINVLSAHYQIKLLEAFHQFHQLHKHRKEALFTQFLPQGYSLVTLDCVPENSRDEVIFVKSLLGMHITLYDDLADNPELTNLALLTELYKIPFETQLLRSSNNSDYEQRLVNFARHITQEMTAILETLPHYEALKDVFEFDFKQFYNANQYYSLAFKNTYLLNSWEIKFIGPFNMGMIIAGTIDIMASPTFAMTDLGATRILLSLAQRFGHICNTITTLEREIHEHTYTNEAVIISREQGVLSEQDLNDEKYQFIVDTISPARNQLITEQQKILSDLSRCAQSIKSWNAHRYVINLTRLQTLHEQFAGII